MIRINVAFAVAAVSLLLVACSGVNNGAAEPPPQLALAAPTFDVGAFDEFKYAAAATRLNNGVVVVADAHAGAVRFFDSAGRQVHSSGPKGIRPGEFQVPTWLGACAGDSVFVSDAALGRMTVLDHGGQLGRVYSMKDIRPSVIECSRDGQFAYLSSPAPAGLPDPRQKPVVLEGELWLGDANGFITVKAGAVPIGELAPLGKAARIAISGGRVFFASGDSSAIDVYDLKGRKTATIPAHLDRRPATQRHFDAYVDNAAAIYTDSAAREFNKQFSAQFPVPQHLPLFSRILGDPNGNVWVVTSFPGDTVTTLRVLSGKGRLRADVTIPDVLTVYEVGADYILGSGRGEDGRPHVVMYSFDPAALRQ